MPPAPCCCPNPPDPVQVASEVAAQQKQRILEGVGVVPAPVPAGGEAAGLAEPTPLEV